MGASAGVCLQKDRQQQSHLKLTGCLGEMSRRFNNPVPEPSVAAAVAAEDVGTAAAAAN